MKIFFKNNIIGFIIGLIVAGSIGVVAYTINASDVRYTPKDTTWNVNNVDDALNTLKSNSISKPVLLWTNPDHTSPFEAQTINLDLSKYRYIIVTNISRIDVDATPRGNVIVAVGSNNNYVGMGCAGTNGLRDVRNVKATTSGVIFTDTYWGSGVENNYVIPYKIYGIKDDLGLDLGI